MKALALRYPSFFATGGRAKLAFMLAYNIRSEFGWV